MARLTAEAEQQIIALTDHYLAKERPEAVRRLQQTLRSAIAAVDSPTTRWRPAPTPYPALASAGFRWISLHRYWIAYLVEEGEGIIHHVAYAMADIPGRLSDR